MRFTLLIILLGCLCIPPVQASLTTLATFTGNVGYSSSGIGTLNNGGTVQALVPVGSTVLKAYLYTASNFDLSGTLGGTFNGNAVPYGPFVLNTGVGGELGTRRADVTSIVAPVINSGPGGTYSFDVTETNTYAQDGEALVVVYENPTLATSTVAILDGFSAAGGDSFTATFSSPLHPASAGFFAEMALGINFSCCGQKSTVKVNGITITNNAGNMDDGTALANGSLITVGGPLDPFSPFLPSYDADHERYNIVPQIADGSTGITVNTNNPSNDDNIFLAVFHASGEATVVPSGVPEPSTVLLLATVMGAIGFKLRKRLS